MSLTKLISKAVGDKRRWRAYKARVRRLPEPYRAALEAIERYLMYAGGLVDADSASSLFEDLADLFERSAADGTPIRDVVGEDPVEFVDAFLRNYPEGRWIEREETRLNEAITRAAQGEA